MTIMLLIKRNLNSGDEKWNASILWHLALQTMGFSDLQYPGDDVQLGAAVSAGLIRYPISASILPVSIRIFDYRPYPAT